MNKKYLSVLLSISILSIGIISMNLASAQISYTPSSSTGMTSGMNSQTGTLGSNSASSGSSMAGTLTPNSSMQTSSNSPAGTLSGTLGSNLQLNTGSNTVCLNGIMSPQGNCVDAQTGMILGSPSTNVGPSMFAGSAKVTIVSGAGSGGAGGSCAVANNCFSPSSLKISKGDIVTWINADNEIHTVTSGYSTGRDVGTLFDKTITRGNSVSIPFDNVGMINYFCRIHPWLTGQVMVEPTQNGTNSQGGILSTPYASATYGMGSQVSPVSPITNSTVNSQAGTLAPSSSMQSNAGSNPCSTGTLNSQGLCGQPTQSGMSHQGGYMPNSSNQSSPMQGSSSGMSNGMTTGSNSSMTGSNSSMGGTLGSSSGMSNGMTTGSNSSMTGSNSSMGGTLGSSSGMSNGMTTGSNSSMTGSNSSMGGTLGSSSGMSNGMTTGSNSSMTGSNSSMGVTLGPNSTSSTGSNTTTGSKNATGGNSLVFTETGLRTGWGVCWPFWACVPSWGVMNNGQANNATTNTLSISAPSGEYSYTVVSPTGYTASPPSGKLMISGNANQTIHFVANP